MDKVARAVFPLIVIVLLVYLASQTLLGDGGGNERIAYSDLIAKVEDEPESIENVLFVPKSREIRVTLTDGSTLESNYPTEASQLEFQHRLERNNVHFDSKGTRDSAWWSILTYLLPFVLFFGFWIFLMRRAQPGRRRQDDLGSPVERDDAYSGGTSRY